MDPTHSNTDKEAVTPEEVFLSGLAFLRCSIDMEYAVQSLAIQDMTREFQTRLHGHQSLQAQTAAREIADLRGVMDELTNLRNESFDTYQRYFQKYHNDTHLLEGFAVPDGVEDAEGN